MKSPFLALLLIVNLLTCPVRCLACGANAAVGEECAPAKGGCCEHCVAVPVSESGGHDLPCGDDCDCQNCICEGALVEGTAEDATELPGGNLLVDWIQPVTDRVAASRDFDARHFNHRRSFPTDGKLLYGRDARLAHQSWQI